VREPEQLAALVDEAVVDAPRVDAGTDDALAILLSRFAQARADFGEELEEIPVVTAEDGMAGITESVHFLKLQRAAVEDTGHDATTGSAEIDCEKYLLQTMFS
jgi:hypothetical protein